MKLPLVTEFRKSVADQRSVDRAANLDAASSLYEQPRALRGELNPSRMKNPTTKPQATRMHEKVTG
ncbi:MAG: hypothetical protein WBZ32_02110 [Candidatus Acidiferrales bacterium]